MEKQCIEKNLNLMGLLQDNKQRKGFSIEIPALQRDYAQGRWAQKEIGKGFVKALLEVLENDDDKGLHLDFIYGYVEGQDSKKFILIDGQQRLTTLWLLHLYLYKRAGKVDAKAKDWLGRFSYAARSGAQEFCKKLLALSFCASKKPSVVFDEAKKDGVSDVAKNDPTVAAMLNMLDWIHAKVEGLDAKNGQEPKPKDPEKLVENLNKITFDFFDMEQFGLGEELYIKMNARGKPLSEYENIKALIEKGVEDKELLRRIDAEWSDYFYSDDKNSGFKERGRLFDERGGNFLYYSALFLGLKKYFDSDMDNQEENKKLEDEGSGGVNKARDIFKQIELKDRPEFYGPLEDWENLKWLDRVMELFRRMHFESSLSELLRSERLEMLTNASFFDDMKHVRKCYFVAILWYCKICEAHKWDAGKLLDYLKVVRHLVENHPTSNSDFYLLKFFKLFERLSDGASDIYSFMVGMGESSIEELEIYKGAFVNKVLKGIFALEVRKAILIAKSRSGGDDWEGVLDGVERHVVLRGRVDFLLDFSDVDFDGEKWRDEVRYCNPRFEVFRRYATIAMKLLDRDFLAKNLSLLQRAWLCMGDCSEPQTYWSHGCYREQIYSCAQDSFNGRDAWHRVFSGNGKKTFFKNLLDGFDEADDKEALCQKMKKLVENYIDSKDFESRKWWEQLLIKQEEHFALIGQYDGITKQNAFNTPEVLQVRLLKGRDYAPKRGDRDLLYHGFYHYCKSECKLNVSDYENEDKFEIRMGDKTYSVDSRDEKQANKFYLVDVEQHRANIMIDNTPHSISLDGESDIFAEFEKVLKKYESCCQMRLQSN